jgi:hypothetical protein
MSKEGGLEERRASARALGQGKTWPPDFEVAWYARVRVGPEAGGLVEVKGIARGIERSA